jgi:hypothetical protein
MEGAEQRRRHEYELATYTAWHMAALSRYNGKKFPKLKDIMPRWRSRERQTPDQMWAIALMWDARVNRKKA